MDFIDEMNEQDSKVACINCLTYVNDCKLISITTGTDWYSFLGNDCRKASGLLHDQQD